MNRFATLTLATAFVAALTLAAGAYTRAPDTGDSMQLGNFSVSLSVKDIAASKAFTKWIKKNHLPTLATHHDFYWERKEFQLPRNGYLKNYMEKFMPPKSKYITP